MLSLARSKAVVGSIALAFLVGTLGAPVAAHEGEHTGCSGPAHEMSAAARALQDEWRSARGDLASLENEARPALKELERDARAELREVLSGAGRQVDHAVRDARWAIRDLFEVELLACAEEGETFTVPSPAKAQYAEIVAGAATLMEQIMTQAKASADELVADVVNGTTPEADAVEQVKDKAEKAKRAAERRTEKEKRTAEKQAESAKRLAEKQTENAKRQAEREAEKAKRLAERAERDGGEADEDEDPEDEDENDDEDDEDEEEES